MTQIEVIEALKNEASINPTFNAVCHDFAVRRRARHSVTLSSLQRRMEKEGFNFSKDQYAAVLKKLSSLGLGTLANDAKGRLQSLKDVKTTLQSIGAAGCGEEPILARYRQRNRFKALPVPAKASKDSSGPLVQATLNILVNGKPLHITGVEALSSEELSVIISRFSRQGAV